MKTTTLAAWLGLSSLAAAQDAALPPIVVTVPRDGGYAPGDVSVGGLGGEETPVLLTPASVTVFTRAALADQGQSTLSDAVRRDAFAGDSYAPVGYYQNIELRGFPLDLGTGYRIDGLTVAGEQNVALENKERLEIWTGASGLESGEASPGGMVNYVTKRPADVLSLTCSANGSGASSFAADFGRVLDGDARTGLRVNAADEELSPPVAHAIGRRNFASLAADWGFSDDGLLRFDADYQRRVQNSVPGYQLLGGTALPPLPDPSKLLGWQPWTKPVAVDSYNASLTLDDELAPGLRLHAAAGRSAAHIDDNIAFPYGCGASQYFCANGDYTLYDFRSSGERRRADDVVVSVSGDAAPFGIPQTWTAGAEYFERAVDMSSWIYVQVGTDNIFNPNPVVVPPSGAAAPVAYRILNHVQDSLFARDVIENGPWRLNAGARWTRVDEKSYDPGTGNFLADDAMDRLMPELGVLRRVGESASVYASYSEGLELGGLAPSGTNNAEAVMPAQVARQFELGAKREADGVLASVAAFRAWRPDAFIDPNDSYVQSGREVHTGVEASASGEAVPGVQLQASATYMRAVQENTDTPAYNGRTVPNVPEFQAAVFADAALPFVSKAGVFGGWRFTSSKEVLPDGSVAAPAAQVFDAGLRWAFAVRGARVSLRLSVDNLFDVRYWRDVAQQYLFEGLPRCETFTAAVGF